MESKGIGSLSLYPEERAFRRPTARNVTDLFQDMYRHDLVSGKRPPEVFVTDLTSLHRKIFPLLGMSEVYLN